MANSKTGVPVDFITEAIKNAINTKIQFEVDRQVEEIKRSLDDMKPTIVAGVVLQMAKYVSYESVGEILTIKVNSKDL